MKTTNKSTKFIASLNNKSDKIEEIARIPDENGVEINHVSSMLGTLVGRQMLPSKNSKTSMNLRIEN